MSAAHPWKKAALISKGYYTKHKAKNKLNVIIVEASAITEEGGIIPGASAGASSELIQMADKVRLNVKPAPVVGIRSSFFPLPGRRSYSVLNDRTYSRTNPSPDHHRGEYCNAFF